MPTPRELPVENLALRFLKAVEAVADGLAPKRKYLVDQMLRATLSVYLNLREGVGEWSAGEKARFYRMAARSLRETLGCLRVALMVQPELAPLIFAAGALGDELRPKLIRFATFHGKRAEDKK